MTQIHDDITSAVHGSRLLFLVIDLSLLVNESLIVIQEHPV
ncbi:MULTISPECIES: hypothetical protein [Agrobacterium]|nr:hypothetical protein [Agrobacterium sp. DSM 25558]